MIRNLIVKEIAKSVQKLFKKKVDFSVSATGRHGDYASNAAMVIGGNPRQNAEKIKKKLEKSKRFSSYISKIDVAGPGFLNFYLSEEGLAEGVKNIGEKPVKKKWKVQVEFVSANPTGELHIGHGRSAFYGDALSNVLESAGYKVEREYFINDSKESAQIKELGKTVLGKGKSYLTDYLKKKIKTIAGKLPSSIPVITGKDSRRQISQLDFSAVGYITAQEIQKDNKKFIEKDLKIKFNRWFSEEKELRKKTAFKKALDLLKKKKLVYKKEGALWLRTSKYGDNEDKVILRSDASVPYFLSDIAYHIDKSKRGFGKLIDIWGADHQGHVKRMMAVRQMLEIKPELEILISQLVTLKKGKELKKLSKRKGDIILLKDLVKDIGLDATRWFYLEKSLSTHMEFDLDLAKKRSQKNPVYYVQYMHARMSSILRKYKTSQKLRTGAKQKFVVKIVGGGVPFRFGGMGLSDFSRELLSSDPTRKLIIKLIQFPEVVEDTANDYQVQRITKYAYELAGEFSQFYRDVRVIGSKNEKELLALVALTRKTLADVLKLLGISAPEKM